MSGGVRGIRTYSRSVQAKVSFLNLAAVPFNS